MGGFQMTMSDMRKSDNISTGNKVNRTGRSIIQLYNQPIEEEPSA